MALSLNTFNVTPIQGQMDLPDFSSVITGQVDTAFAGTALVPGQAVKQIAASSGLPKFTALTANTDKTAGFVAYDPKDASYAANKPFECAISGGVMFMTSGAAIAAGANLEVVYNGGTGGTVITNAGTNPVVGTALDSASAASQLIRVKIKLGTL